MTPKYSPILRLLKKNIHKVVIPKKIFIFLKTQKNNEIQNLNQKKKDRAYVCMKISEYPPPHPHPPPSPPGKILFLIFNSLKIFNFRFLIF